ncbi:MAG: hypothetical protein AAFV90_30380 [Cyanobacteria bacterium J06634_5]
MLKKAQGRGPNVVVKKYAIAQDIDLPYETAKTHSKLARRAMKKRMNDE